jgi:hypothetical protein
MFKSFSAENSTTTSHEQSYIDENYNIYCKKYKHRNTQKTKAVTPFVIDYSYCI